MGDPADDIWTQLGQNPEASGVVYRRLHPDSGRDLRAVLDTDTGVRSLVFERQWRPSDELPALVQSRAVKMRAERRAGGQRMAFVMTLSDATFTDVFTVLARDVADATAAAPDDRQATVVLFEQLERWRSLLQRLRDEGLTSEFRRGLFAELHLLRTLLLPALEPLAAVDGWTGPMLAHQDFQYTFCAVEVKSTVGRQPQHVTVSSERELDDTGVGTLYLFHVSLDERRGGDGVSLHDSVAAIEAALAQDTAARTLLQEKLVRYGYHAQQRHLYGEPRYTVRQTNLYRVTDGFPRLVEAGLPEGVGAVRYNLVLAACTQWRVDDVDLVADLIGSGGGVT